MNRRQRRKNVTAGLFLAPSLCGVCLFSVLPFGDVVRRSFLDARGYAFVGMQNFRIVWGNGAFSLAVANTLRFMITVIPVLFVFSLYLSILIAQSKKGQRLFRISLVLPIVIPAAAIILVWKILFCTDGFFNQVLSFISKRKWDLDWVNGQTAFLVLTVTYLWKNTGYDLLLWLAGLSAIPESLYDAARVDGAGSLAQIRYVILPCLRGTMGLVMVLSVVNSFRVYREAYLLAGSYPDLSIYMLPHLFSHWFITLDVQKMSTAAVMLVVGAGIAVGIFYAIVAGIKHKDGHFSAF